MRRHTVLKGIQIEVERIRIHATTEHLLAVVGFFMDTLSAPLPPLSLRSLSALCSPLRLSPVRALSLPRAAGAHSPHPAWRTPHPIAPLRHR
jgi:hypothetical protein